MRSAPPVSVRCTGGTVWRWVQAAVHALAAAVCVVWLLQSLDRVGAVTVGSGLMTVSAASVALVVAAVAWKLARQPAALLTWDGQRWTVGDLPMTPAVMVDLGGWLLLRLQGADPSQARRHSRHCWLSVSRADAGAALHGLRTALFASAAPVTKPARPRDV